MNLPLLLTYFRILAIPAVILFYILPSSHTHFLAALIFGIASATDWLDGYLARKYNLSTKLGAFLDPVADKLIVCTTLVLLSSYLSSVWITVMAMIIIGREVAVSALREWLAELGKRKKVAVNVVGKFKTTFQLGGIAFLVWGGPQYLPKQYWFGFGLLVVASVLTIWSMINYLKIAWPDLTSEEKST